MRKLLKDAENEIRMQDIRLMVRHLIQMKKLTTNSGAKSSTGSSFYPKNYRINAFTE